jgi:hypothetical protein
MNLRTRVYYCLRQSEANNLPLRTAGQPARNPKLPLPAMPIFQMPLFRWAEKFRLYGCMSSRLPFINVDHLRVVEHRFAAENTDTVKCPTTRRARCL